MAYTVTPLPPLDDQTVIDLMEHANDIGLKLEATLEGLTYETAPGVRHQEIILAVIQGVSRVQSAKGPCDCYLAYDAAIRLRDGSVKRPDISVFCRRPTEMEGLVHTVPEAVIEITSPGYEDKDLVWGPPLYLRNGIAEVITLDRRSNTVHRWTSSDHEEHESPHEFTLACGCIVTV